MVKQSLKSNSHRVNDQQNILSEQSAVRRNDVGTTSFQDWKLCINDEIVEEIEIRNNEFI